MSPLGDPSASKLEHSYSCDWRAPRSQGRSQSRPRLMLITYFMLVQQVKFSIPLSLGHQ